MNCEMCGKTSERFYKIEVEGVILKVCQRCSTFGTLKQNVKPVRPIKRYVPSISRPARRRNEAVEVVVSGYGSLVKNAREKRGLKQEDVAKQLHEKESLISQVESEKKEPRIELARKLERFFHITLVEVVSEKEHFESDGKESGPLTVGDMIKIRTRK